MSSPPAPFRMPIPKLMLNNVVSGGGWGLGERVDYQPSAAAQQKAMPAASTAASEAPGASSPPQAAPTPAVPSATHVDAAATKVTPPHIPSLQLNQPGRERSVRPEAHLTTTSTPDPKPARSPIAPVPAASPSFWPPCTLASSCIPDQLSSTSRGPSRKNSTDFEATGDSPSIHAVLSPPLGAAGGSNGHLWVSSLLPNERRKYKQPALTKLRLQGRDWSVDTVLDTVQGVTCMDIVMDDTNVFGNYNCAVEAPAPAPSAVASLDGRPSEGSTKSSKLGGDTLWCGHCDGSLSIVNLFFNSEERVIPARNDSEMVLLLHAPRMHLGHECREIVGVDASITSIPEQASPGSLMPLSAAAPLPPAAPLSLLDPTVWTVSANGRINVWHVPSRGHLLETSVLLRHNNQPAVITSMTLFPMIGRLRKRDASEAGSEEGEGQEDPLYQQHFIALTIKGDSSTYLIDVAALEAWRCQLPRGDEAPRRTEPLGDNLIFTLWQTGKTSDPRIVTVIAAPKGTAGDATLPLMRQNPVTFAQRSPSSESPERLSIGGFDSMNQLMNSTNVGPGTNVAELAERLSPEDNYASFNNTFTGSATANWSLMNTRNATVLVTSCCVIEEQACYILFGDGSLAMMRVELTDGQQQVIHQGQNGASFSFCAGTFTFKLLRVVPLNASWLALLPGADTAVAALRCDPVDTSSVKHRLALMTTDAYSDPVVSLTGEDTFCFSAALNGPPLQQRTELVVNGSSTFVAAAMDLCTCCPHCADHRHHISAGRDGRRRVLTLATTAITEVLGAWGFHSPSSWMPPTVTEADVPPLALPRAIEEQHHSPFVPPLTFPPAIVEPCSVVSQGPPSPAAHSTGRPPQGNSTAPPTPKVEQQQPPSKATPSPPPQQAPPSAAARATVTKEEFERDALDERVQVAVRRQLRHAKAKLEDFAALYSDVILSQQNLAEALAQERQGASELSSASPLESVARCILGAPLSQGDKRASLDLGGEFDQGEEDDEDDEDDDFNLKRRRAPAPPEEELRARREAEDDIKYQLYRYSTAEGKTAARIIKRWAEGMEHQLHRREASPAAPSTNKKKSTASPSKDESQQATGHTATMLAALECRHQQQIAALNHQHRMMMSQQAVMWRQWSHMVSQLGFHADELQAHSGTDGSGSSSVTSSGQSLPDSTPVSQLKLSCEAAAMLSVDSSAAELSAGMSKVTQSVGQYLRHVRSVAAAPAPIAHHDHQHAPPPATKRSGSANSLADIPDRAHAKGGARGSSKSSPVGDGPSSVSARAMYLPLASDRSHTTANGGNNGQHTNRTHHSLGYLDDEVRGSDEDDETSDSIGMRRDPVVALHALRPQLTDAATFASNVGTKIETAQQHVTPDNLGVIKGFVDLCWYESVLADATILAAEMQMGTPTDRSTMENTAAGEVATVRQQLRRSGDLWRSKAPPLLSCDATAAPPPISETDHYGFFRWTIEWSSALWHVLSPAAQGPDLNVGLATIRHWHATAKELENRCAGLRKRMHLRGHQPKGAPTVESSSSQFGRSESITELVASHDGNSTNISMDSLAIVETVLSGLADCCECLEEATLEMNTPTGSTPAGATPAAAATAATPRSGRAPTSAWITATTPTSMMSSSTAKYFDVRRRLLSIKAMLARIDDGSHSHDG